MEDALIKLVDLHMRANSKLFRDLKGGFLTVIAKYYLIYYVL